MMRKLVVASVAAMLTALGAASAEECALDAEAPAMPDPAAATEADVSATIAAIKAYQAALGDYRACLDAIVENKELEKDVRKAALEKFNASVDAETAMVEDWQAFNAAYEGAQD